MDEEQTPAEHCQKNYPVFLTETGGLKPDCYMLAENAVAISADFHSDPRYQAFYDENCDSMSGFPGIWKHITDVATYFSTVEAELKAELGEDLWDEHDWIAAIDGTADRIYAENTFTAKDWKAAIRKIILVDSAFRPPAVWTNSED